MKTVIGWYKYISLSLSKIKKGKTHGKKKIA